MNGTYGYHLKQVTHQQSCFSNALMAKLVDAPELGSGSERIEGSTPSRGTDYALVAELVDAPVSDAGPK